MEEDLEICDPVPLLFIRKKWWQTHSLYFIMINQKLNEHVRYILFFHIWKYMNIHEYTSYIHIYFLFPSHHWLTQNYPLVIPKWSLILSNTSGICCTPHNDVVLICLLNIIPIPHDGILPQFLCVQTIVKNVTSETGKWCALNPKYLDELHYSWNQFIKITCSFLTPGLIWKSISCF